jgi:bifunctional non-homologous end joining protein LigD
MCQHRFRELGLPSYPKTSGRTGLHVLVPIGRGLNYEQQKLLGDVIARVVEPQLDDIAATDRNPWKRDGKVYIDYLQNGRGKLIVYPHQHGLVEPMETAG